jgi:hypothetical protein
LPSLQEVPFARMLFWQLPLLQTSVVHGLASLQSPLTVHDWHPGTAVCEQPLTALHPSVVHGLASSQLSGVPEVQIPV